MKLQEALDRATTNARRVKEGHVRQVKGQRGKTDIQTVIECYRGDGLAATVFLPPDRDAMLKAAWYAAAGFSPDVITVTMETYQRWAEMREGELGEVLNPVTNRPIEQGDLQRLAQDHDGIAKGWVTEALVTQALNRAGDSVAAIQPYRIDGRSVEWVEQDHPDGEPEFAGLVPDSLARAMANDSVDQVAARDPSMTQLRAGLGEERAQAHADVAAVAVLSAALEGEVGPHMLVLLAADRPGSVRAQVLRDRLPRSQVIYTPKPNNN